MNILSAHIRYSFAVMFVVLGFNVAFKNLRPYREGACL